MQEISVAYILSSCSFSFIILLFRTALEAVHTTSTYFFPYHTTKYPTAYLRVAQKKDIKSEDNIKKDLNLYK